MNLLVLGATGTVGSALVAELARRGLAPRAATRDPAAHAFPAGVTPVAFDYADPALVAAAVSGVDRMFVLAPPGLADQAERWRALFAAAREAGVRHVVLMTAKGAGPDTPHAEGEAALRASGLSWTVLQPTFFMQNLSTYSGETIRRDGAFYLPAGDGRAAFVDARDIAAAAAEALVHPEAHAGRTYELTGSESLSLAEVAALLSEAAGRPIRYVDPGAEAYRAALEAVGLPPDLAAMFTHLYAVVVKNGWAAATTDDVSRVLGRAPSRFAEFARDHASDWAARP